MSSSSSSENTFEYTPPTDEEIQQLKEAAENRPIHRPDPLVYCKIIVNPNTPEEHIFFVDEHALRHASPLYADALAFCTTADTGGGTASAPSSSSLSDDPQPACSSSSFASGITVLGDEHALEEHNTLSQAVREMVRFFYYKKAWAGVILEPIPEYTWEPLDKIVRDHLLYLMAIKERMI